MARELCRLALDIAYQGTYLAAIRGKKKKLFLTLIGGEALVFLFLGRAVIPHVFPRRRFEAGRGFFSILIGCGIRR